MMRRALSAEESSKAENLQAGLLTRLVGIEIPEATAAFSRRQ